MLCFECLEEIGKERICPYCGTEMFPADDEVNRMLKKNAVNPQREKQGEIFDDEEILARGLYPKDEGYKMSLISSILGKK